MYIKVWKQKLYIKCKNKEDVFVKITKKLKKIWFCKIIFLIVKIVTRYVCIIFTWFWIQLVNFCRLKIALIVARVIITKKAEEVFCFVPFKNQSTFLAFFYIRDYVCVREFWAAKSLYVCLYPWYLQTGWLGQDEIWKLLHILISDVQNF